jgi:hypothetical protein
MAFSKILRMRGAAKGNSKNVLLTSGHKIMALPSSNFTNEEPLARLIKDNLNIGTMKQYWSNPEVVESTFFIM